MEPRARFPKSRRIRLSLEFSAVFDGRVRASAGPLSVHGVGNDLGFTRIGLSTPKRVGIAVKRNRIRRLLRESFRHLQHELPRSYDFVVVVRPHETLAAGDYRELLARLCEKVDAIWQKTKSARDHSSA